MDDKVIKIMGDLIRYKVWTTKDACTLTLEIELPRRGVEDQYKIVELVYGKVDMQISKSGVSENE